MKKYLSLVGTLVFLSFAAFSQQEKLLFDSEEILELTMSFSVKKLRSETNDSTFIDSFLGFRNSAGVLDTLDVELRARGNFRKANCYYPPIRMRLKKQEGKGNLFDGSRNLKIVFPCQRGKNADAYVVKEFLCYKLYEQVSDYTFQTRMIRINFFNEDDKKGQSEQLIGFLIEDDDKVAERFEGEILENKKIIGAVLEDSSAIRHDLFQYMIGNTDWSSMYQHNMKILKLDEKTVVPLAYDFDMTGMVLPPYAQVSNLVAIKTVSQRLYRGFCRDEAMMQAIREEFMEKEEALFSEIADLEPLVPGYEIKFMTNYLKEFYEILRDDKRFENNILAACRTTE
ncbi:hypothetical protein [Algoriphagus sp.]|uniref:hypothetical protein n=1 Tax=Algoriphagus sp. TaxID=1872435 RepID=UPI003288E731